MKKLFKIFPGSFIFIFLGSLIPFWFMGFSSSSRTFYNFICFFALMIILYFPIWLATLGQERSENFPHLTKHLNNKFIASIIIVIWSIAALYALGYFKSIQ